MKKDEKEKQTKLILQESHSFDINERTKLNKAGTDNNCGHKGNKSSAHNLKETYGMSK